MSKICAQIVKEYFDVDIIADFSRIKKEHRELILNARQRMKEKFEHSLSQIKQGQMVYVSDLFFITFFNVIFENNIVRESSELIKNLVLQLIDENGGCKPSNSFQYSWQNKPRIYSTYYSLMLLKLIGILGSFLEHKDTWCTNTYRCLRRCQLLEGNNSGSFVELDSPSTIAPENNFWAVCCLNLLGNLMPSEEKIKHNEAIMNAVRWTLNFLHNKKRWSITRLLYALNLLKLTDRLGLLDNENKTCLIDFIEKVHFDKGFREFHLENAKAGYREEKAHQSAFIHSTFHVLRIFKLLGLKEKYEKYLADAKELVVRHQCNGEFGVQITVKDYKYGPATTSYETLCATLILLS